MRTCIQVRLLETFLLDTISGGGAHRAPAEVGHRDVHSEPEAEPEPEPEPELDRKPKLHPDRKPKLHPDRKRKLHPDRSLSFTLTTGEPLGLCAPERVHACMHTHTHTHR